MKINREKRSKNVFIQRVGDQQVNEAAKRDRETGKSDRSRLNEMRKEISDAYEAAIKTKPKGMEELIKEITKSGRY